MQKTVFSRTTFAFYLDKIFWLILWLGLSFIAFSIWAAPAVPLMDMNEWAWQGHVAGNILQGGGFAENIGFKTWPVSNSLVPGILTIFGLVDASFFGAKVIATGCLFLFMYLLWVAIRHAPEQHRAAIAVTALSIGVGTSFMNGYLNFVLGFLGVALFTAVLELRRAPNPVITAILGILLFFTHAVALATFSIVVASYVFFTRLSFRHLLALIPAYILFAWYVMAELLGADGAGEVATVESFQWKEALRFVLYKAYTLMKHGPYHNFIYAGASDLERAPLFFWAGVAANVAWAVVLGLVIFFFFRSASDRQLRPLIISVAVCFGLFLILPQFLSAVINPGERFLTVGLLLMVLLGTGYVPTPGVRVMGSVSAFYLASAISLSVFSVAGRDVPEAVGANYSESLRILFSHSPERFRARLIQAQQTSLPADQVDIIFETGLLRTKIP